MQGDRQKAATDLHGGMCEYLGDTRRKRDFLTFTVGGALRRDYAELYAKLEKFPSEKIKFTLQLIELEIVRLKKNPCDNLTPKSVRILSRKILEEVKTLQTVRKETEN